MSLLHTSFFPEKTRKCLQFAGASVFYLFFAFLDGPGFSPDSYGYIQMSAIREPVYPLFLWIVRTIFQHTSIDYIQVVLILQSLLAAYAAWSLCAVLTRELKLNPLLSWCTLCVPVGVSLVYRLFSASNRMLSNAILSEGLAISLFLIFFSFLFAYTVSGRRKPLWIAAVLSLILISIRKQMLLTLALLILSVFLRGWLLRRERGKWFLRHGLTAIILAASILLGTSVLDLGYNLIFTGNSSGHTGGSRFIAAIAVYTADREDVQYIADPELQTLYLEIYDHCDQSGYLADPNLSGWQARALHFENNIDNIQLRTLFDKTLAFSGEKYPDDQGAANSYADEIMTGFTLALIPRHIPEVSILFISNCISGFVYTVAKPSSLLIPFSALVYLAYTALLIWICILGRKDPVCRNLALFSLLSLLSTAINVAVVAIGIFPQARYMIYNMYLIYTASALMGMRLCISLHDRLLPRKTP